MGGRRASRGAVLQKGSTLPAESPYGVLLYIWSVPLPIACCGSAGEALPTAQLHYLCVGCRLL